MTENTHEPIARKEITTRNRKGREVNFEYTYYARTPEFESEMEKKRLGEFLKITPYQKTGTWINDRRFLAIVPTLHEARKIVATKIKRGSLRFRAMVGGDILNDYLDDEESKKIREGYPREELLFLFFGYGEALNKALPGIISHLVVQRTRRNQHLWIFVPSSLANLASEWKDYGGRTVRSLDSNIRVVQFADSDME